jgi:acid phosphatase family membrane protein YuiD
MKNLRMEIITKVRPSTKNFTVQAVILGHLANIMKETISMVNKKVKENIGGQMVNITRGQFLGIDAMGLG